MFQINGDSLSDSYFFGLSCRYKFSKGKVHVSDFSADKTIQKVFDLKVARLPQEMPVEDVLDEERQIKWFLKNGYVPQRVDNDTKVCFVKACTEEQDIRIQELSRKCEDAATLLAKFSRWMRDNKIEDTRAEEYQGWHTLLARCGEAEFKKLVPIMYDLIDECKQFLKKKQLYDAEECLVALQKLTLTTYIFTDLHADLLSFTGETKEAAAKYFALRGRSVVFLEKALRCDPENPDVAAAIVDQDERAQHCCLTGYLACKNKKGEIAQGYLTKAKCIDKRVVAEIFSPRSRAGTPLSRTSESRQQAQPVRVLDLSVGVLKSQYKDAPTIKHELRLLWEYDGSKDWVRSEYFARRLYTQTERYDVGMALARALVGQDKRDEAERFYFQLAKVEHKAAHIERVRECLSNIKNYNAFTTEEKRVIYLLLLEMKEDEKPLKEVLKTTRGSRNVAPAPISKRYHHSGEWAWCAVDHPHYVACASTVTELFLFTGKTVEVRGKSYPLEMTLNLPDDVQLFGKERILWALEQGYIPRVYEGRVIFVEKSFSFDSLKPCCEELVKCKDYLERGHKGLASYYMHKAYSENPNSEDCRFFYAEFLLLTDKPKEALELFLSLKKPTLYSLQRAVVAASLCNEATINGLYKNAENKSEDPQPLKVHRTIFTRQADGETFGELVAALACEENSLGRKKLYQKLAEISSNQVHVAKYYLAKAELEGGVNPVSLKLAREGRKRKDMQLFASFLKTKRAVKKCIPDLIRLVEAKEYEKAEDLVWQARDAYRVMAVQELVNQLHQSWLQYVRGMRQGDALAPFFATDLFCSQVATIKACQDSTQTISACMSELEQAVARRDFEAAKKALLRVHQLAEVTDIQDEMKQLFIDYSHLPFLPTWAERFDSLFANVCITSPICTEVPLGALEVNLEEIEEREGTYKAINAELSKYQEANGARFLLCLHAFFYFKEQGLEKQAVYFYKRAFELNQNSLLFDCATILQLTTRREQIEVYNRVVGVCESEKALEEYLGSQRDFIAVSSLEGYVKEQCRAVLVMMEQEEKCRSALVVIDTLLEKKCYGPLPGLFQLLTPSTARDKRQCIWCKATNQHFGFSTALKALKAAYLQEEHPKSAVLKRLVDKHVTRSETERVQELLADGREDEAAQYYFERAFFFFLEGKRDEAAKRLRALQELDPEQEYFNLEERLILNLLSMQLLEKQLAESQLDN